MRSAALLVAITAAFLTTGGVAGLVTAPAANAAGSKLDVVFAFDVTGSMSGVTDLARARARMIMDELTARGYDVRFGVVSYMDYVGYYDSYGYYDEYGAAASGDYPYRLDQGLTYDRNAAKNAIQGLVIGYGGDGPQDYARIFYESYAGSWAWRVDAKRVLVNFGDNVPHDNDINEGVLPYAESTGGDPGRDSAMFTADDIDLQQALKGMRAAGVSLIEAHNSWDYRENWDYWTGLTGGDLFFVDSGTIVDDVVNAILVSRPTASRTDLVNALNDLRTAILWQQTQDVQNVAEAYTITAILAQWQWTEWLSLIWRSLRMSVQAVSKVVCAVVDLTMDQMVRGQVLAKPGSWGSAVDRFAKALADAGGDIKVRVMSAGIFFEEMVGDFKDLQDYDLIIPRLDQLSESAEQWRKQYGSDGYDEIQRAMAMEINWSAVGATVLREGSWWEDPRPATRSTNNAGSVATEINRQFRAMIASVPDTLPAGFDCAGAVAAIRATTREVWGANQRDVRFMNSSGTSIPARRAVSLGAVAVGMQTQRRLLGAYNERLVVRQKEVWQDAVGTAAAVVDIYAAGKSGGVFTYWKAARVVQMPSDAYKNTRKVIVPEQEVRPVTAMSLNQNTMMLSLKDELGRLYQIVSGTKGYLKYELTY